jgi:glycyl-tRNA synthetase alpha subunit
MERDRKGTDIYLLDISYIYSMNKFEEFFGDNVSFSYIEQESYIDLKKMMFHYINDKIKFRKFERCEKSLTLTLKVEMFENEYKKLKNLIKNNKIKFLHDYKITKIEKI